MAFAANSYRDANPLSADTVEPASSTRATRGRPCASRNWIRRIVWILTVIWIQNKCEFTPNRYTDWHIETGCPHAEQHALVPPRPTQDAPAHAAHCDRR